MENNSLQHHGVLGQKWGVRRYQNKDGSLTSAGRNRHGKDDDDNKNEVLVRKTAVKNRRTMSDAELKQRIARLKMEKELKDLTDDDISKGKKYVSEILSASGKKALTTVAAGTIAYAIKVAMTKEFNAKDAAQYIAANPNKKK